MKYIKGLMMLFVFQALLIATGCKVQENEMLQITFIDVGKGDCILLETMNSNVMIDTGYEITYVVVSDILEQKGLTSLDGLILTHYDKDHIGGAFDLLNEQIGRAHV